MACRGRVRLRDSTALGDPFTRLNPGVLQPRARGRLAHSRRRKIESALVTSSPKLNLRLIAAHRPAIESRRFDPRITPRPGRAWAAISSPPELDFEAATGGCLAVESVWSTERCPRAP